MKNNLGPLNSKRFIALLLAIIMFTVMIYTTNYSPLELSSSISVLFGIYATAQTYRGSNKDV